MGALRIDVRRLLSPIECKVHRRRTLRILKLPLSPLPSASVSRASSAVNKKISYLFVGVWGSYKIHTIISDFARGYMDSPKLILWDSMSLKLTFNATLLTSKHSIIVEC
jgi:hypothetical protein